LIKVRDQLKEQLKDSHHSKDLLFLELSEKTKACMNLESEKSAITQQLNNERAKVD
jgi:hypothetical protein